MTDVTATVNSFYEDAQRDAKSADRDVARASAKVRDALDAVDTAVERGLSVPSSVSGAPFVADDADRLHEALRTREHAYRRLVDIKHLASELGVAPEVDRPHRFDVGQRVRHVDTEAGDDGSVIVAQTWRARGGTLYPTYTLRDDATGDAFADVLDTDDLTSAAR